MTRFVLIAAILVTPAAASAKTTFDPIVPPAGCAMQYHGGPVVSHVQVVPVFWTGDVDRGVQIWAGGYLSRLVDSPFLDALSEYGTAGFLGGTNQTIGRGSATESYVIAPSAMASPLQSGDIVDEIWHQFEAGYLPKPTVDAEGYTNTLYVVFFPKGSALAESDGSRTDSRTCSFCGYHASGYLGSDPTRNLVSVAVIPDLTPGSPCAQRCGACDPGDLDCRDFSPDYETTVSHEVGEGVTDATFTAWYGDSACASTEIGDVCRAITGEAGAFDTGAVPDTWPTVYAQYLWSNQNAACEISNASIGPQPGPSAIASDAGAPDSGATRDAGGGDDDGGALSDGGGATADGSDDDAQSGPALNGGGGPDGGRRDDGGTTAGDDGGTPPGDAGTSPSSGGSGDKHGPPPVFVGSSNACAMTPARSRAPFAWGGALLGLAAIGRARRKR
jgi:hypothetical protein